MKRFVLIFAFLSAFTATLFSQSMLSNLQRNPLTPTSSQSVTICVDVFNNIGIASVTLFHGTDTLLGSYTPVPMTNTTGNTWCGDIPAHPNATFVRFYVCADDSNAVTSCGPSVPNGADPSFFIVRDSGTTIYDLQFIPITFNSDWPAYVDMVVTVEGVVTASMEPGNLGYVYIQQEGLQRWAGLSLMDTNQTALNSLVIGDKVRVTGRMHEWFGFTRMIEISAVNVVGSGTISPVSITPPLFATPSLQTTEAYESMLITLEDSTGPIYVLKRNADLPNAFGEYLLGKDLQDSSNGCRVLAGRQDTYAYSSLDVSYVNDSMWATQDGVMNVPVIEVEKGDEFCSVTGLMHYSFGSPKLLPRNNQDFDLSCLVGVAEKEKPALKMSPNPARDVVWVEITGERWRRGSKLEVWRIDGKKVMERKEDGEIGLLELNLEEWAAGLYWLVLKREDGAVWEVQKLIKLR